LKNLHKLEEKRSKKPLELITGKFKMMNIKYDILITPVDGQPYTIMLETADLDWSMEQYARNRTPFTYEVRKKWQ
jgi:hypothetical protein